MALVKVIQKELDILKAKFNNHKVRTDHTKLILSGVSPSLAYLLCEAYGGKNVWNLLTEM